MRFNKFSQLLHENPEALIKLSYLVLRETLIDAEKELVQTSRKHANIFVDNGPHRWAAILFTQICVKCKSYLLVLPDTKAKRTKHHWDYTSVAALERSLHETYLAFFYMCIDEINQSEWKFRWHLINLHDCCRREENVPKTTASDISQESPDIEEELRTRIREHPMFKELVSSSKKPEKKAKELLSGRNAFLLSLEEIAERAGYDRGAFKARYNYLSNYSHGLPISFTRIGMDDRGRGYENQCEVDLCKASIIFVLTILCSAQDEMNELFDKLPPTIGNLTPDDLAIPQDEFKL